MEISPGYFILSIRWGNNILDILGYVKYITKINFILFFLSKNMSNIKRKITYVTCIH